MKVCNTCKELKNIDMYFRNKNSKDGRHSSCKDCQKNKNYDSEKRRIYYNLNKERDKENNKLRRRKYYILNKERENVMSKCYKENNKDYINKKAIEHYHKIKETNIFKENKRIYFKNKLNNDPLYKLTHYIRCMINTHFKKVGFIKNNNSFEILGCSFEEFKKYIENKFEDWMTWENRGLYNGELNYGWDIDHIIPISSTETEEDVIRLNHYTNLQPLCSYVNRVIKKNKIDLSF